MEVILRRPGVWWGVCNQVSCTGQDAISGKMSYRVIEVMLTDVFDFVSTEVSSLEPTK